MGAIHDAMKRAGSQGLGAPEAVRPDAREPAHAEPDRPGRRTGIRAAPRLVAVSDPSGLAAEHFRAIRSRVLRASDAHGYRSLLVTSAGRGDGKSTTAANLALLLAAEIGRRVLLVDGDLRKPAVHTLFGVQRAPGVSDVALGRAPWAETVAGAACNGLALIPAGAKVDNPTELLNGPLARQFLNEVRAAYDFVVVDAPPVLPVADAVVMGNLVDAVLLVARAEQTPREALAEATKALSAAQILGVVFNGVPDRSLVRRRYYYYY